jgi:hypothetical protein
MKSILIALTTLLPLTALAQYPMEMNEADMQNMMQQMQRAQACMEKIDQSQLQELESRARQYEAEMKSLCAKGDRDAAQEKAMVYAKDIMNHPAVQEAKHCGEMMQGAMKGMMQDMSVMSQDKDYSKVHVCDAL